MELNLQRQSMTMNEVVYDGSAEQPIECDALLPEYCPDIVRILKCAIDPQITAAVVSGDRLNLEGNAAAHVYYCAEGGVLRHTEVKIPFARSVELGNTPVSPLVTVTPGVDYVNCRAVNQRRLDIRGALALYVRVTGMREEEVISDAQGGGLQLRREMVKVTDQVSQQDTIFPVSETLELAYGKAAVSAVLRSDVRVNLQESRIVSGRVMVKGELLLHVAYQPMEQENRLEVMEYTLPLSQVIEADGAEEDCICDVSVSTAACELTPKQNEDGEYRQLALEVKLRAVASVFRHREIPVACDCYSTRYACPIKTRPVRFLQLADVFRETITHRAALDLPDEVDSVLDAWCDLNGLEWTLEGSTALVQIRLCVAMFTCQQDGEMAYFEQIAELEQRITVPAGLENLRIEPTAEILGCSYSLPGTAQLELRCDILLSGRILGEANCHALCEIALDEDSPKERVENRLVLYYAAEGESIWNIAKAYNTSASAIWEENAVESDILTGRTMLLIPIV